MGLSDEERREILRKLEDSGNISVEPLHEFISTDQVDLSTSLLSLSFLQKLIVFLKSIFQRKERLIVVEEHLLSRIAKKIDKDHPGLISWKEGEVNNLFYQEVSKLQNSLSCFGPYLKKALGNDKREYLAFLAGFELPVIQEELLKATDPFAIAEERVMESDLDVKREAETRMNSVFDEFTEDERQVMYANAKTLQYLNSLVFFSFDRILTSFSGYRSSAPESCSMIELRKPLSELLDILTSLGYPPGMRLLESLFLFYHQKNDEEGEDEIIDRIKPFTTGAEKALEQIRLFNRNVPLLDILKLINHNINYIPGKIGGGEDWYSLYKQFWKNRFEQLYEKFTLIRKKTRTTEEVKRYLHIEELPALSYYKSGTIEQAPPFKYELSLSFLLGFIKHVFLKEMQKTLKIVLWDGDFYKDQNRKEFTDSYEGIINSLKDIQALNSDLSSAGEWGASLEQIEKELIPPALKRKKISIITEKADSRAGEIVLKTLRNLELLNNVVGGILFGEVGGKFDTLSNIGQLGRREGQSILVTLGLVHKKSERAFQILKELYDTETSMV